MHNESSQKKPLVTILVISYNSSSFILETLESAKNQTYKNIELIICDDASIDGTVKLCSDWLKINSFRFRRTELIVAEKNRGIPSNCNKGLLSAQGEWVKLIAGDDVLLDSCIEDNLNFAGTSRHNFIFSKPQWINDKSEIDKTIIAPVRYKNNHNFFNLNAENQFLFLITKNHPINPPTIFFKRDVLNELNGFDETFPNEDFPLYLKATKNGHKLSFLDKETIQYRVHHSSLSQNVKKNTAVSFWKKLRLRKVIRKHISFSLFLKHPFFVIEYYNQLVYSEILITMGNKKSHKGYLKYFRYLSPLLFFDRMKKLK